MSERDPACGAQVQHLSSRDNPLLVRLRKLQRDPAGYRKAGEVWLEGKHLCSAALARGVRPKQVVMSETGWGDLALRTLIESDMRVAVVPDALFASLSTLESIAHIAFVLALPEHDGLQPHAATVVLDRVQDAGNVGTILRSAAAFGVDQVVAIKGTAALWSPKVLRAAMGAHFALHLVEGCADEDLLALKVPRLATSSHEGQALHETRVPRPCAWIFGHEGQGVSAELLATCDLKVRIAQPGGEESLNVAVAASICLYEATRQWLARA